jgi:hypothetical protein
MLNEVLSLELTLLAIVAFLVQVQEIASMWYLGGLYLFVLGFNLLRQGGDIWVGFLWVIDLGVGLIFFIFILHLANFLTQKTYFNIATRSLLWAGGVVIFLGKYLSLLSMPVSLRGDVTFGRSFWVSWYDYYEFFAAALTSDLGILKEMYFVTNSFEFVLINFMLLYGILTAITLAFGLKRLFSRWHAESFMRDESFRRTDATFLIRTQNLITQQQQTTDTRVWKKQRN